MLGYVCMRIVCRHMSVCPYAYVRMPISVGYSQDGRCLSGPLSCLSMNSRFMITDSFGRPGPVMEVLDTRMLPYSGSLTGLAVNFDVGKVWACGREEEAGPYSVHTFSYWGMQLMAQVFVSCSLRVVETG